MNTSLLLSTLFFLQGAFAQSEKEEEKSSSISGTVGIIISVLVFLVILIGMCVALRKPRASKKSSLSPKEKGVHSPSAVYEVFTSSSTANRTRRTESAAASYEAVSSDTVIDVKEDIQNWKLASLGEGRHQPSAVDVEEEQTWEYQYASPKNEQAVPAVDVEAEQPWEYEYASEGEVVDEEQQPPAVDVEAEQPWEYEYALEGEVEEEDPQTWEVTARGTYVIDLETLDTGRATEKSYYVELA